MTVHDFYSNILRIDCNTKDCVMTEDQWLSLDHSCLATAVNGEVKNLEDAIPEVDILYMTRIQRERFADPLEYERVKNSYILHNHMLDGSKDNLKVLHPLPRVNEINIDVDKNPKAYYFQQALNGVYMREALLAHTLGLK